MEASDLSETDLISFQSSVAFESNGADRTSVTLLSLEMRKKGRECEEPTHVHTHAHRISGENYYTHIKGITISRLLSLSLSLSFTHTDTQTQTNAYTHTQTPTPRLSQAIKND